jgi:DHA1 family multidrug/chloramphenicol efflux transport protein-like MFS transporter
LGFVVVSYPALQEAFNESDAIRLIALFANIALLSPLFGPLVGSVVLAYLSWRTLFIAIALMAALTWFGLLRWMPETIGVVREDGSKIECQPLEVKPSRALMAICLRTHAVYPAALRLASSGCR